MSIRFRKVEIQPHGTGDLSACPKCLKDFRVAEGYFKKAEQGQVEF